MEASCARALAVGLPAIAFTEHLDFTVWTNVEPAPDAPAKVTNLITADGTLAPNAGQLRHCGSCPVCPKGQTAECLGQCDLS